MKKVFQQHNKVPGMVNYSYYFIQQIVCSLWIKKEYQ